MSNNGYRISEKAINDLEQIWIYTFEKWPLEQADRYYNLLISEIEYIAVNFSEGKPMNHIREGYRASKVKSHFIFYRLCDDDIVEVIRILHQRMDIKYRLKE